MSQSRNLRRKKPSISEVKKQLRYEEKIKEYSELNGEQLTEEYKKKMSSTDRYALMYVWRQLNAMAKSLSQEQIDELKTDEG